jgi:retinol dehydrogenase 12
MTDAINEKVALVTGGTSGIGKAAATAISRQGVTVVLMVRNRAHAAKAVGDIRAQSPAAKLETIDCDLESQASVRKAASEFLRRHSKLDILLCSAGVFLKERRETVDGIEATFATNYLSHFLLTQLVEGALKAAAPSRVVFVASRYGNAKIDFDDLMIKNSKFSVLNSVPRTKLAEILLAQELAERWQPWRIAANALHPGLVARTHLLEEVGGFFKFVTNLFGGTPEKGADTAVWLATSPEAANITGKFLTNRKVVATPGQGSDPVVRRRLWAESEKLVAGVA